MAKLNGRRARYGWRSDININRWWKRKEHKRIRQIENKEWQDEAISELLNYVINYIEDQELIKSPAFQESYKAWKDGDIIEI